MASTLEEVKEALGEYFPALVKNLKEGDEVHSAIDVGIQALAAGSLSWARLNQVMHLCSEAGMSEGSTVTISWSFRRSIPTKLTRYSLTQHTRLLLVPRR